jgi:hypothetical protein
MRNDVGYVSVDEHFSGCEIDQLSRRHPAIRAADPEVVWGLLMREAVKELRISSFDSFSPGPVPRKKIIQAAHTYSLKQRCSIAPV